MSEHKCKEIGPICCGKEQSRRRHVLNLIHENKKLKEQLAVLQANAKSVEDWDKKELSLRFIIEAQRTKAYEDVATIEALKEQLKLLHSKIDALTHEPERTSRTWGLLAFFRESRPHA